MGSLTVEEKNAYEELNEQLEESARKLFEKVEYVAKVRNSLDLHDSADVEDKEDEVLEVQSSPASQKDSAISLRTFNVAELNVTEDLGFRGVICTFNAKVEKMQQAYDKLAEKYRTKDEEVSKHLRENLKLLDEKEQWMLISLEDQANVNHLEEQVATLRTKLENKDEEMFQLLITIEKLQKDVYTAKSDFSELALRHGRTTEEYETVLSALQAAKREEKTLRERHDKQVSELETAMQNIKKHRSKLLLTLKKHLKEFDTSKKQKVISK